MTLFVGLARTGLSSMRQKQESPGKDSITRSYAVRYTKKNSLIAIGRTAQVLARSKLDDIEIREVIEKDFDNDGAVWAVTRAAVAVVDTSQYGTLEKIGSDHLISAIYEGSIIGSIDSVARLPMRTRAIASSSPPSAGWVGQGAPIPASAGELSLFSLDPLKVGSIAQFTEELIYSNDADAAAFIGREMVGAGQNAIDAALFDPANAGSADLTPAAIVNGITPVTGSASAKNDIRDLIAAFEGDLKNSAFVMRPETLAYLITEGFDEETIVGAPVFTTRAVPTTGGRHVILFDGAGIAFGMDGASIRTSWQTSLAQSTTPDAEPSMTSTFQTSTVAVRMTISTNWQQMRSNSVAILSGASW